MEVKEAPSRTFSGFAHHHFPYPDLMQLILAHGTTFHFVTVRKERSASKPSFFPVAPHATLTNDATI
jgi:hypothetical protein